jgi:DNA-binding CsgD family transcriptional regulator
LEESNKNALHYNIERIGRFDDLCAMLLEQFPISFVGYLKVFADGTYLGLSNDLIWQEHFVNKVHSNGANFQSAVENTPLGGTYKFQWPHTLDDPVFKALFDFKIWHGLSIYTRGENFIESWSFASKPENDQVRQLYVNKMEILEAFTTRAIQQDSDLFDASDASRLGYFKNGINLHGSAPVSSGFLTNDIPRLRGGIMDAQGKIIFLTKQEIEVLRHFARGKNARETAEILGIGQRTVESYIDNIRDKTGYRKKSEILGKFYSG